MSLQWNLAHSQRFNSDKTSRVFTECVVSTHTGGGSSQSVGKPHLGILLAESCAHTQCLHLIYTLILNIRGTTACLLWEQAEFSIFS